ncbi:Long-chain-fatty-acid--CoA ligase [Aliiroseovarius pelagivivens]|uniref:Long-chain-fatty-acid--CoA ligase n=1 Tax=Aliiroseovarius pelagivivens TaxID=1639690 RepID=A0A2R8ASS1_9RHOB|nr:class I adenylate-forming enzyme family protein [Aliiroseovarius pelagivivens]SPF79106.1 Long-chain-fatty-acid--CoA ligase [Aliiroseovarius pelagivivens]
MHPFDAFLNNTATDPEKPAVAQGHLVWSRAQLLDRAAQLAAALSGQGLQPGQRVLVALPNTADLVALIPAIWSLGGLPMFVSAKATDHQRQLIQSRHAPDLTIDTAGLAQLEAPRPSLGTHRPDASSDASVVFTSGSSGPPKGVVQTGATLTEGVARVARSIGYNPEERILVPIPFAHDYGWGQLLSGLVGGHFLILPERDILPDIAKAINTHRPTVFAGVPSLYSALLFGISGFETADTDSLRLLTSTGSPFTDGLFKALSDRIPAARILRNYGLTETYRTCCLSPDQSASRPGSVGQPIDGVELRIVDGKGSCLPPGQEGEVIHLGKGVFERYLDDPDATSQTRRLLDGQPAVFTGDVGMLCEEGFLHLYGRRDRLIKSLDIRVSLDDVEEAMEDLPNVAEIAVLAREHDIQGSELVAFCVPSEEVTARQIQIAANRALPTHMRPRHIYLLKQMPRTPVGKVDYPALRSKHL